MEILSLTALNYRNIADFQAEAPQGGIFVISDSRYNPEQLFDMIQTLLSGCDDEAAKKLIGPENSYAVISCVMEHENQRYYIDRRLSSAGCALTINGRYYPGKTPVFQTLSGRSAHGITSDHRGFVQKFTSGMSSGSAEPFDYSEASKRLDELESQLMTLSGELDNSRNRQSELFDLSARYDAISREITGLDNQIRFEQAFLSEAANMNRLRDNMLFLQRIAQQAQMLNRFKKWLPDILISYDQLKMRVESLQRLEGQGNQQPEIVNIPQQARETPEVLKYAGEIDLMDPDTAANPDEIMGNMFKVQLDRVNDEVKNICSLHLEQEDNENVTLEMLRSIDLVELDDNIRKHQEINEQLVQVNGLLNFKASNIRGPVIKVIFEILGMLSIILALIYQFSAEITGLLPQATGFIGFLIYYLNYVGIFAIHPPFMLLGAGALFITLAILSWIGKKGSVKRKLERQCRDISTQAESIGNDILQGLKGLPVKKAYIENINKTLETAVRELLDVYQKQAMLQEKTIYETPAVISRANELALQLLGEASDEKANILALKNLLDSARHSMATPGPEPVRMTATHVQNPSKELADATAELAELESMLGANPRAEAQRLNELTAGIKKAISIRDNIIKKTPNFKETAARLSAMSGKGWPYGEQEVAASQGRHEQYLKNRSEMAKRSAEIKDEIDRLSSLPSPVNIDANIMEIQNRVETATVRHDMQILANSALSPDSEAQSNRMNEISRTASRFISMLTNGVSNSITLSAGAVNAPGAQSDTAYEAAYLAIMDGADPGIPLILSGPAYSQRGGMEAAKALSAKRQTVILK